MGHELTAAFGIDHGKTLAVLQPTIWTVRFDKKKAKLAQYAERVWNIKEGSEEEKAKLAIEKTREFFESLGVKTRLADYGVKEEQLDAVVEALKEHGMTNLSETGDLTPDVALKIYKESL